jgi:hypothetical protein
MKLVLLPGVYRKLMTKGGSFSIFGGGRGRAGAKLLRKAEELVRLLKEEGEEAVLASPQVLPGSSAL